MDEKKSNHITGDTLRRRAEERLGENKGTTLPIGADEDQRSLHELQVHQIELEMQNAELLRTRDMLDEMLEKYSDLFNFAPVGYLTLNCEGTIQAVNFTGASLLGLERSHLPGRRFGLFITDECRADFATFLDMVFTNKDNKSCEVTLLNGGNVPLIVQIEARSDEAGQECRLALIDITERKRMENETAHLASFPQMNPNPVLEMDFSGRITFFNPATMKILKSLGMDEADMAVFIPSDINDIIKSWDRLNEVAFDREIIIKNRSFGETVFLTPQSTSVRFYAYDITERKLAEQALLKNERIYRAIGESIDYGIWICSPDGRNTYASDSFLHLVGITQEQCSDFGWGAVLHPDDMERTIEAWKECVRVGGNWDIEHSFLGMDGQWHPILARGVPVRDDTGNITCWAGINLDISRIKDAEKNLRESEERHRLLAETMLQGVVHQDAKGTIISMNPAAERILGKSREDFLGNNSFKVEHHTIRENGERFPGIEHPAMVALRTGQPVQDVVMGVFNPKLDDYRWININAVPVFRPNDKCPSEVYTVFEDTTERKQADGILHQKEERLRLALEAAQMAAWDWHLPSGNVIWNDMHYRMMGYKPGEVQPSYQAWASRVHSDDIDSVQRRIQECMAGRLVYTAEFRTNWPDGTIRWLESRGEIEYNANTEPQRFYGVMLDITERKQAEEMLNKFNEELEKQVMERTAELRDKDQMLLIQNRQAAMGEMIGNIAHQWRQPLNTLGLKIQSLLHFYDLGEFNREYLAKSVSSSMELILHMSETIDDFRNYFKPEKDKVQFKLSEAIANTLSFLKDSFNNEHIKIEVITKDDPAVNGYRNEFAQVILNILNNARDALIERAIGDPQIKITTYSEGDRAVVTISDNAGGIPEEILQKIFDPYFTTKGPQDGTGVGLFMSKAIIETNMGGMLSVRNHVNGAEFRIEV